MNSAEKLQDALKALLHALEFESKARKDDFYYGGIAKAFEVALEYCWKYFRLEAISAGLEVPSPRDAIKQAGRLGLIDTVEQWLNFLKIRNIAAHDYLGISKEEFLSQIKVFAKEARKLLKH